MVTICREQQRIIPGKKDPVSHIDSSLVNSYNHGVKIKYIFRIMKHAGRESGVI